LLFVLEVRGLKPAILILVIFSQSDVLLIEGFAAAVMTQTVSISEVFILMKRVDVPVFIGIRSGIV
jgi:hypothetical protein